MQILAVPFTKTWPTEIKELERQKDAFVSIASHELINQRVSRMINLVNTLLDTTKISEGQLELHRASFDLAEVIKEETEEIQRVTPTHTLRLQLTSLRPIEADRVRIRQVITNLLSNAVKYSPDANEIVISAQEYQDGIQVKIQDFGIGMTEQTQQRIFERFYRSEAKTGEGLGLGLYVAAEIVKKHHGYLRVQSAEGAGSIFYIWLPAHDGQE